MEGPGGADPLQLRVVLYCTCRILDKGLTWYRGEARPSLAAGLWDSFKASAISRPCLEWLPGLYFVLVFVRPALEISARGLLLALTWQAGPTQVLPAARSSVSLG